MEPGIYIIEITEADETTINGQKVDAVIFATYDDEKKEGDWWMDGSSSSLSWLTDILKKRQMETCVEDDE